MKGLRPLYGARRRSYYRYRKDPKDKEVPFSRRNKEKAPFGALQYNPAIL